MATTDDLQSSMQKKEEVVLAPMPIASSYQERIRPLLDCVDNLRNLNVTKEGIQLPTIVVVGDQSSGKSSLLQSLSGISLPRGKSTTTRVPLIMRLVSGSNPQPDITLEYNGKTVLTEENKVCDAISLATTEIIGDNNGVSETPLTLTVKKKGLPDITLVDLPGITRIAKDGQPDNIHQQIAAIIIKYIRPDESIILNVISAETDFNATESLEMSKVVDKEGERTLAVVTKPDVKPEGLFEKVTANDVNVRLGFVVVRNNIGNETCEEGRVAEDPRLSKISKSMVSIPVLAQKLVEVQAAMVSKYLPGIYKKINEKLNLHWLELEKLPEKLDSVGEATREFVNILYSTKLLLTNILIRGQYKEYPDDKKKHCKARLAEMLDVYIHDLKSQCKEDYSREDFLCEEVRILAEARCIGLPNFLPRSAFHSLLQRKVMSISSVSIEFVNKVWGYLEEVLISLLMQNSVSYPQIQSHITRAAQNLIAKKKQQSNEWVIEMIEMEKNADYTSNDEYDTAWNNLMAKQKDFMKLVARNSSTQQLQFTDAFEKTHSITHLCLQDSSMVEQAFDLKMRMTAYWNIIEKRFVDHLVLHILLGIENLVKDEMEKEISVEMIGASGVLKRMLEEPQSISEKRERLDQSIKLLEDAKETVAKIMDKID